MRQQTSKIERLMTGDRLEGRAVDFSHGDVDAHEPTPSGHEAYLEGYANGGAQAYTEYRGDNEIRGLVAERLANFIGAPVDAADGLIITPVRREHCFWPWAQPLGAATRSPSSSPTISPTAS